MAVLTANGFLAISQLPSVPQPAVVTGTATPIENVLPLRIWRLQVFEISLALNGATQPSSSLLKMPQKGFGGVFCLLCLIFGICLSGFLTIFLGAEWRKAVFNMVCGLALLLS